MSRVCPACGRESGGKFCRHCGAGLSAAGCARCGAELAPGARFCSSCGAVTSRDGAPVSGQERWLWFGAGGLAVALLGGLVLWLGRGQPAPVAASAAPFAAGGQAAAAPDISNMTPRERFDRLFNRIMQAAEQGDENTVTQFSPMALGAYSMLDTVDADARYHAALVRLHTGDIDGARALADTILKNQPGHLFGIVIQGTIARFQQNQAALDKSYADFLSHYDAETKAARPEYAEHPRALEDFLAAARGARPRS